MGCSPLNVIKDFCMHFNLIFITVLLAELLSV